METKTLDDLSGLITNYKEATDASLKQLNDMFKQLEEKGGAQPTKEQYAALTDQIKAIDAHSRSLEQKLSQKNLSKDEQVTFDTLLAAALEEQKDQIKEFGQGRSESKRLKLNIKAAGDMGIGTNVTNAGAYFTTVLPGIRTLPNRRTHMRQIVALGSMTSSSVDYMREDGGQGVLLTVAENASKPQIDRQFSEHSAPAQYIAGWLRVSRKMLDDMAAFRSYLQMRLMEMYLIAEDNQILNGDGTGNNLTGLLTVAVALSTVPTIDIEKIVYAMAQLESNDYAATAGIVSPAAYYMLALNKASGSGEYDQPGLIVFQNGQLFVAGIPIYKTTAIGYNQFLVGDFEQGAQLFIRDQPTVEFFEQDANNVTTNKITVRIEGRVALAIFRAEAFVKGTFANVPNFVPTT